MVLERPRQDKRGYGLLHVNVSTVARWVHISVLIHAVMCVLFKTADRAGWRFLFYFCKCRAYGSLYSRMAGTNEAGSYDACGIACRACGINLTQFEDRVSLPVKLATVQR